MTIAYYIDTNTGGFPLYEGDIRLVHPEIGEVFSLPVHYSTVLNTDPPNHDPDTQVRLISGHMVNGGVLEITWIVRELTPEEAEFRRVALLPPPQPPQPEPPPTQPLSSVSFL